MTLGFSTGSLHRAAILHSAEDTAWDTHSLSWVAGFRTFLLIMCSRTWWLRQSGLHKESLINNPTLYIEPHLLCHHCGAGIRQ